MDGSPTKAEDGAVDRRSSGYKSWKKKYRKMRIVFDHKMQHGEELHKQEEKASATVKRLAVENDRLLDLLVEINNSPQIPPEKRIDVSLEPPTNPKAAALEMDRQRALQKDDAMKRLEQLLADVPHASYRASRDSHAAYTADLAPPSGEAHPATFLSADDVDNYIYAVDASLDAHMPTLAPRAHPAANPITHPHLKNPTSVTNWLRKHAPKIFLQDGETHGDGGDDADGHGHGAGGHGHAGGRKSRGARGERGGRGGTRGKRASAAARLAATAAADRTGDWDASMDDDADFASGAAHGRAAKRKRDDDGGYRPGGSTTRPTKKKRKSEGDGPPSARRSKKDKEAAAAAAAAAAAQED